MPAAARVHRRDQLHPRREGDMGIGAGDAARCPVSKRLASESSTAPAEFRQLVEEQHAEIGKAHLPGRP
jgi:hypothetical protein